MGSEKVSGPWRERFSPKVKKGSPTECWIWTGALDRGYGILGLSPKDKDRQSKRKAHQLAWILAFGAIPDGMSVLHECDNPGCVNPDHLFLGTQADNMKDMRSKGRGAKEEKHGGSILNRDQVREIRRLYKVGVGRTELAKRFGVKYHTIYDILIKRIWKHI